MAGLALRRLPRELERFLTNPIPGCDLSVVGGELRSLPIVLLLRVDKPAILEGTAYAGERFELTITCDEGYPFAPPQFKVSSKHIPLHTHIYRCARGRVAVALVVRAADRSPLPTPHAATASSA